MHVTQCSLSEVTKFTKHFQRTLTFLYIAENPCCLHQYFLINRNCPSVMSKNIFFHVPMSSRVLDMSIIPIYDILLQYFGFGILPHNLLLWRPCSHWLEIYNTVQTSRGRTWKGISFYYGHNVFINIPHKTRSHTSLHFADQIWVHFQESLGSIRFVWDCWCSRKGWRGLIMCAG